MTTIGVGGPIYPDSFADNVADSLEQMGHHVVRLGGGRPLRYHGRALGYVDRLLGPDVSTNAAWQRRIVARARQSNIEMTVNVDATYKPETVAALRDLGPVALWYPDSISNLDGTECQVAEPYTAAFFKDPIWVEEVRASLPNVHYLNEACNPHWHRPVPRDEVDPVIVVAGNFYPSRVLVLEQLHKAGIPLALYGYRWARLVRQMDVTVKRLRIRPPVYRSEKAEVFRRAAGVLNNLHPHERGTNCRLFEAAGCGAVVLAESRPVLKEVFVPELEVLDFSTPDELVDRCRQALQDLGQLTVVGDAAASRAHAEHTYEHRLGEIAAQMGITL